MLTGVHEASTPGLHVPSSINLDAYSRPRAQTSTSKPSEETNPSIRSSELLLQSSEHPRLDYTGRENESALDALWNHFVAVYDEKNGTLQLVEARNMALRGCVRTEAPKDEDEEEEAEGEALVSRFRILSIPGHEKGRREKTVNVYANIF